MRANLRGGTKKPMGSQPARRRIGGHFLSEYPIVFWVLMIVIFVPFLNLTTAAFRAYFLRSAVLDAAHRSARALTWESGNPAERQNAKQMAENIVREFAAGYKGIEVDNVRSLIVEQPYRDLGKQPVFSETKLNSVDTDENQYYIQVEAQGKAFPFLPYGGPVFSNIPGLTGPITLNLNARELFESPDGLTE